MSQNGHRIATQIFLVVNGLVWLPWGLICLFAPGAWAGEVIPGLAVYDLSGAVARTEVRAMYGGLQIAVGVLALVGAFVPKHRDTAFLFFLLALSGLALSRIAGMILEGDGRYLVFSTTVTPETYNQNVSRCTSCRASCSPGSSS